MLNRVDSPVYLGILDRISILTFECSIYFSKLDFAFVCVSDEF